MRILCLLLLLSFQMARAQQYTVIHVIGKIYDNSTSSYLKSGSKLAESSKLKFETPGARAAALSSSRGRYVIQSGKNTNRQGDLAYTLSSVLSPARGKMSTRAGGINNQMDFAKKLGEGPVAIINGSYKLAISPTSYPTDEVKFFYASYDFNGEAINKKLEVVNDQLVFDVNSFYRVDDILIDADRTSDTRLFYYDSDKQESTEMTAINFRVVANEDLLGIRNSFSDMAKEEQIDAILDVVSGMFGKCDKEQIQDALQNLE